MQFVAFVFLFFLSSCSSVQTTEYISRADHPYERKLHASFEKVVSSTVYILKRQGWSVAEEAIPSIYERDERYDNGYQNLLILTKAKKKFLHLTNMHLNVFIHGRDNTADVEIRYEAQTSMIKQFVSTRNDQFIEDIFDDIEKDLGRNYG